MGSQRMTKAAWTSVVGRPVGRAWLSGYSRMADSVDISSQIHSFYSDSFQSIVLSTCRLWYFIHALYDHYSPILDLQSY